MSIPVELRQTVVQWEDNVIRRIRGAKMHGRMDQEFIWVLKGFFEEHKEEDWKSIRYEEIDCEARSQPKECICSHAIWNVCYIVHLPSGLEFQVGIDCVEKVSKSCYDEMLAIRKAYKKEKKDKKEAERKELVLKEFRERRMEEQKQDEHKQEPIEIILPSRINKCKDCKKDITEARKKYPYIRKCWTCANPPTGKCKNCGISIDPKYPKCYTCNKAKRYFYACDDIYLSE